MWSPPVQASAPPLPTFAGVDAIAVHVPPAMLYRQKSLVLFPRNA